MDIKKIWSDLQELPSLTIKIGKKDPVAIGQLDYLSRLLFGQGVQAGCSNCHTKAFVKLTNITYKKLQEMESKKYQLKKGITIEYPVRSGNFFNSESLTDEQAAKYLKAEPTGSKHFDKISASAEEEKPLDKMNKEQLRLVYKDEFGEDAPEEMTKAELIKDIKNG